MAEESLRDIINESNKPPSKLRIVILVVFSLLIIIGGAYYAISTLSNSVVTPSLPSLLGIPGLQQKEATAPASATQEQPKITQEENLSDKDDTTTLQKELDSTVLQDSSSSDSETLEKDIKQL